MKTIGLIGGMSWESSLEYYRIINETVRDRLGKSHSSKSIMYSVDFAEYNRLQHEGKWDELGRKMGNIAEKLEKAGAAMILICTNTMHKTAPMIKKNINIPLIHIADTAAEAVKKRNIEKVGLLGTEFTMEEDFYKKRLWDKHQIKVIIPPRKAREEVHRIIFQELISGIIREESRVKFQNIIEEMKSKGAEGVILGCTEIPLLIQDKDSVLPVFNTTKLHATKAVKLALQ